MNEKIDLKALERKAYFTYHEDGLLDIGIGAVLAWIAMVALVDFNFPFYLWYIIGVSIWTTAKKQITVPRIGYVKFRETRKGRIKRLISLFLLVLTVTMVTGVLVFKAAGAVESPGWLITQQNNGDILLGAVLLGGGLLSVGYSTEVRRFTNYGIAAVTLHVLNHFLTLNPTWDIWQGMAPVNLLLGLVMLGNGYMLLRRFKKKYPPTGEHLDE
jgi:hypothetical protein